MFFFLKEKPLPTRTVQIGMATTVPLVLEDGGVNGCLILSLNLLCHTSEIQK